MLALRSNLAEPVMLSIAPAAGRASIGSRRNPASTRAILEAAAQILVRDGIAGFSIDAIAREARCGKPTVYRWWTDKLALLSELHATSLGALPSGDDLDIATWSDATMSFWQTTVAGTALRAIVAEAQASTDGAARLREALVPYELAAAATTDAREPGVARAAVAQALVALLTDSSTQSSVVFTRPAPTTDAGASLRHRGEWVD